MVSFNQVKQCYNDCFEVAPEDSEDYYAASAYLTAGGISQGYDVDSHGCHGNMTFFDTSDGMLTVYYRLFNCPPAGQHGLHVHKSADFSEGCDSTSWHFNPNGATHGGLGEDVSETHVGDFGNIWVDDKNEAIGMFRDSLAPLRPWDGTYYNIIGRSIVLHESKDDLEDESSAGARIACAEIFEDLDALLVIDSEEELIPEEIDLDPCKMEENSGTYIVDNVYGNDEYSGSVECPIKTLQGALDKMEEGATVIVQPGTYYDAVDFDD